MTQFIRVRSAEGPAHEFDVPEIALRRHADRYVVIDPTPVSTPRPARYVTDSPEETPEASTPVVATTPTKRTRKPRAATNKKE